MDLKVIYAKLRNATTESLYNGNLLKEVMGGCWSFLHLNHCVGGNVQWKLFRKLIQTLSINYFCEFSL